MLFTGYIPESRIPITHSGNQTIIELDLGPLGEFRDTLKGVVEKESNGNFRVYSSAHPDGEVYNKNFHLVVCVIDGKVLDENGKYNIYCFYPKDNGYAILSTSHIVNDKERPVLDALLCCSKNISATCKPKKNTYPFP